MNRNKLLENSNLSITSDELKSKLDSRVPLLLFDIRDSKTFEKRHIPGSACAVCNGETKRTIMPRLPKDMEIVLVGEQTPDDSEENYTKQMAEMMRQIGLNSRYLEGGISSWKWEFNESIDGDISPNDLKKLIDSEKTKENLFLLDVREPDEFSQWSIDGSKNIPLGKLSDPESLAMIPNDKKIVTICPHGNRSTIGKYILERYGYNVSSLEGGLKAWSFSFEIATTEYNIDDLPTKIRLFQIRRIGKGCMSYLIDSGGQSVIIDPVYPINEYLDKASEIGTKIIKIIDTHQHADHVSAANSLAKVTGAQYLQSSYESYSKEAISTNRVKDGDIISVGKIKLKAIHTPGHTLGSISFLIEGDINSVDGQEKFTRLLFTGDTLFVNGVGRPDLRDKAKEFSENLYNTLHQKIMILPSDTVILPSHFDKDVKANELLSSTLGRLKEKGIFLNQKLTREQFIQNLSAKVMAAPPNYLEIISINKGEKPYPSSFEILELEIGPNRCSVTS